MLGSGALAAKQRPDDPLVSLVVPVLDEEDCIDEFVRRASAAARSAGVRCEILFVDDGSRALLPSASPHFTRPIPQSRPSVSHAASAIRPRSLRASPTQVVMQ